MRIAIHTDAPARVTMRLGSGRTIERSTGRGDHTLSVGTGDAELDSVVVRTGGRTIRL